jgi:hypothetical protein
VPTPSTAVIAIRIRPLIVAESGARITSATPTMPTSVATIRWAASGSPSIMSTTMLGV